MGLRDFFARWRKEKSASEPEEEKEDSRPEKSEEASGEAAAGEDVSGGAAYDEAFMAEHFEGLGEVWAALLGQASLIRDHLATIGRDGVCHEYCSVLFQSADLTASLLQYPDNSRDIRAGMLLATPSGEKTSLVSCFPVMEGLPNPLRIRKSHTWSNGLEGVVAAERVHDGPPVTFFAPFLFRDEPRFEPETEALVSLAALAFSCRKAGMQKFTVEEGPWYEEELQRFLAKNPGKSEADFSAPVVSMQGARILMPQRYACEWQYRCPVLEVARTEVLGQPVYKLHVVFVGVDEETLAGYLYVPERLLDGYIPQAGDDIEGTLWMTGMLCAEWGK